ncbi:hypothetical protein SNEBB_002243 [Seison nebaliae]|nr:hypothetical protein SNEBB_002243 [Seison nebaliae]
MYGMLLESLHFFIVKEYGKDVWETVLRKCFIFEQYFITHKVYDESYIPNLANALASITLKSADNHLKYFGEYFVRYLSYYGYDKLLRVAGRDFSDLLHTIDEIHETMNFTFPRMKSPSFYVENETDYGIQLHYHSCRKGYTSYVIGQLETLAKMLYNIEIAVTPEDRSGESGSYIVFHIKFDNQPKRKKMVVKYETTGNCLLFGDNNYERIKQQQLENMGNTILSKRNRIINGIFPTFKFLKIFPFHIIIDKELRIRHMGNSLSRIPISKNFLGSKLLKHFHIRRPSVNCSFERIVNFSSYHLFELETKLNLGKKSHCTTSLVLKGQMKHFPVWNCIIFICRPLLENIQEMEQLGLFINDLCLFDVSRTVIIEGTNRHFKLKKNFMKATDLVDQMHCINDRLRKQESRTKELLFDLFPYQIAQMIENGKNVFEINETFEDISLMMIRLSNLDILQSISPPKLLIEQLNHLNRTIEILIKSYHVTRVNFGNDSSYIIASGIRKMNEDTNMIKSDSNTSLMKTVEDFQMSDESIMSDVMSQTKTEPNLTEILLILAMDIRESVKKSKLISENFHFQIGIHTGNAMGCIVGHETIQYFLFGQIVEETKLIMNYCADKEILLSNEAALFINKSQYNIVQIEKCLDNPETNKKCWVSSCY